MAWMLPALAIDTSFSATSLMSSGLTVLNNIERSLFTSLPHGFPRPNLCPGKKRPVVLSFPFAPFGDAIVL